jgi:hypothetical protein
VTRPVNNKDANIYDAEIAGQLHLCTSSTTLT